MSLDVTVAIAHFVFTREFFKLHAAGRVALSYLLVDFGLKGFGRVSRDSGKLGSVTEDDVDFLMRKSCVHPQKTRTNTISRHGKTST